MKITIIGSTVYKPLFDDYKLVMEKRGHEVLIPAFDDHPDFKNELELCEYNRSLIEKADKIMVIWDGRSMGTWGDFMMAFALRKPVEIIFIESKTPAGVMMMYAEKFREGGN